jgi:hypothetical protein
MQLKLPFQRIRNLLFMKGFRAGFLNSTPRNAHSLIMREKQIPISIS